MSRLVSEKSGIQAKCVHVGVCFTFNYSQTPTTFSVEVKLIKKLKNKNISFKWIHVTGPNFGRRHHYTQQSSFFISDHCPAPLYLATPLS